MSKTPIANTCAYCRAVMRPRVMQCPDCGVEVRADFRQGAFDLLDSDEQELLGNFLLAGFSIKALETQTGMGYTAIRSRLDRLIEKYGALAGDEREKKRILDRLAAGDITAAQAAKLIAHIGKDKP